MPPPPNPLPSFFAAHTRKRLLIRPELLEGMAVWLCEHLRRADAGYLTARNQVRRGQVESAEAQMKYWENVASGILNMLRSLPVSMTVQQVIDAHEFSQMWRDATLNQHPLSRQRSPRIVHEETGEAGA